MTITAPEAVLRLTGHRAFLAAATQLLSQARERVCLLTQQLDPRIFGDAGFVLAAQHFLLSSRRAQLQVLVAEPPRAVAGLHPLLELGQRLPSRAQFRAFSPEQVVPVDELLLVDGRQLLQRQTTDALYAQWQRDPMVARTPQRRFDALWDHALPSTELRRLSL